MKTKFIIKRFSLVLGLPLYLAMSSVSYGAYVKITQVPMTVRDVSSTTANLFLLFDNSDSMRYQHLPESISCPWNTTYSKYTDLYRETDARCADADYNVSFYSGRRLSQGIDPETGEFKIIWEKDYPTPYSNRRLPDPDDEEGIKTIPEELGQSDYKNAWRQGYWNVIKDDPYNSRDKHVQDLRLNRPYNNASETNNNKASGNSGFGGTTYEGAYSVYLSSTRGSRATGEPGQYVQCRLSKVRTTPNNNNYPGWTPDDNTLNSRTSGYIYSDCSTRLPGSYDYESIMNNSWYGTALEDGSRAWFSKDGADVKGSHTEGFICENRQQHSPAQQTRSTRYTSDKPAGTYYSKCIDLDLPENKGKTVVGYKLPSAIYTYQDDEGKPTRSEVFYSSHDSVGNYNSGNGGLYQNGFVCKNRFGGTPYLYSDCDIAPGNDQYVQGYRIAEGFSYSKRKDGVAIGNNTNSNYEKIYVRDPEEWKRVANWFSYYRYRMHIARAAFSFAFTDFPDGYYIAWDDINNDKYTTMTTPAVGNNPRRTGRVPHFVSGPGSTSTPGGMVRFSDGKEDLYEWVFHLSPQGVTPLRRSLSRVGSYLMYSNEPWATDPSNYTNESSLLSCRNNFAIMMTDGYWNSGGAYQAITNREDSEDAKADPSSSHKDGGDAWGGLITPDGDGEPYLFKAEFPYKHLTVNSNTSLDGTESLADTAMYYWRRDLRPDMANDVKATTIHSSNPDFAFWQHLNSSFLGLGVEPGTERASNEPSFTREDAFNAVETKSRIYWAGAGTNRGKADDLLHAAINGRGNFFNGNDAAGFREAFTSLVNSISGRSTGNANLATNIQSGVTEADSGGKRYIFHATYFSYLWTGELSAYEFTETQNPVSGQVTSQLSSTPVWTASGKIPPYDQRNIVTYKTSLSSSGRFESGQMVPFWWDELSQQQRTALGSNGQLLVNYIRGDRSNEGTQFRTRQSLLGDIVNSTPIFVGAPDPEKYASHTYPEADQYKEWAESLKDLTPMVYVGANDGMLHGFNATNGVEAFAYVPGALVNSRLGILADQGYNNLHRYFVDGEITVEPAYVGGKWRLMLVGTLGRGGKSVFGVDVTDPSSPQVMWEVGADAEFYGTRTSDTMFRMGYYPGKVSIVRWRGTWVAILGNGYDNGSCGHGDDAVLLILDLATGKPMTNTENLALSQDGTCNYPNGFFSPLVLLNQAGEAVMAYVGDFRGNMVRINLDRARPSRTYLFRGPDSRPITTMPLALTRQNGDLWIYFGTGSWLRNLDVADNSVQTFYGIHDKGTRVTERLLTEVKIVSDHTIPSATAGERTLQVQTPPRNSQGWYMRLQHGSANGERMLMQPYYRGGVLFGHSMVPMAASACDASTTGWIYTLDPFSGEPQSQFVVNGYVVTGGYMPGETLGAPVYTGGGTVVYGGSSGNIFESPAKDSARHSMEGVPMRKIWRGLGVSQ